MTKDELFIPIVEKYDELKAALKGTDIEKIRKLTLEVHAMVHPAEISGRTEKNNCGLCFRLYAFGKSERNSAERK